MAISLDPSTPGFANNPPILPYSSSFGNPPVWGSSPINGQVPVSFTPPSGSLVVAMVVGAVGGADPSGFIFTCSDSASNVYTQAAVYQAAHQTVSIVFYHYYATSPGAITVKVTDANTTGLFRAYVVGIQVLAGSASVQNGATGSNGSPSTGKTYTGSITTTAAGSWVYVASGNDNANGILTVADAQTEALYLLGESTHTNDFFAFGEQAAATVTPGAETLGFTGSVNSDDFSWAAFEALPIQTITYDVTLTGAASVNPAVSRRISKTLPGPLAPSGGVTRRISKTLTAVVAAPSSIVAQFTRIILGLLFRLGVVNTNWTIPPVDIVQSQLSSAPVIIPVKATVAGVNYDPTGDIVQVAFMPNAVQSPGDTDWQSAFWIASSSPLYPQSVQCVVGPNGVQLGTGRYQVFIKISDDPETPVRFCGELAIN